MPTEGLQHAHLLLGHSQDAIACYRHARRLLRDLEDRYFEAVTLVRLGDAHHAAGDSQATCDAWHESLAILDNLRHPDAFRVRAKLRSHRGANLRLQLDKPDRGAAAPGAVGAGPEPVR